VDIKNINDLENIPKKSDVYNIGMKIIVYLRQLTFICGTVGRTQRPASVFLDSIEVFDYS